MLKIFPDVQLTHLHSMVGVYPTLSDLTGGNYSSHLTGLTDKQVKLGEK